MSDVNAFIDAIGQDVSATVVPRVEGLVEGIGAKAASDYLPSLTTFANQLAKAVIDEQAVVVREFAASLIQDLFQRYRPELTGELNARIVQDGVELQGDGIRLDLTRRDTGAAVSSLDIPVSMKIRIDPLTLAIQGTTIKLDVL
jgi:hypothetical protein